VRPRPLSLFYNPRMWFGPTLQALLCSIYCDPDLATATTPLTVPVGRQPAIRVASTAGRWGFQPCQPGSLTVWSELENEPYRFEWPFVVPRT